MTTLTTIKNSIKEELRTISELFDLGLLTPQERFSMDFKAKESYKRIIRMTKN